MRQRTARWLLLSALSACASPTESPQVGGPSPGELDLNLDLGDSGVTSVDYVITGAGGFSKLGSVDVSKSNKLAARIGGLPAGSGYTIVLSADATDPPATCTGSAGFDVTPGETTPVELALQCVEINADINACPLLESLSALPNQVAIGGAITLSADVNDPDSAPAPLAYDWSTTSGALSSSGSSATLTCTTNGVANVTLTVNDGDAACATSESVVVTCGQGSDPVARPVPVPTPFVALLAAQLLAVGAGLSARRRRR